MSSRDRTQDAFKTAVEATRAGIRRDRTRAPTVLKKLFTVISARLLDPSLDATRAWKAAGIRSRGLGSVFRAVTETSVKYYIEARRAKLADILMATTDLDLYSISQRIGFTHYLTFTAVYQRQRNKSPSDVPRPHLPPALLATVTPLLAGRAMLGKDEALRYVKNLRQIHPAAAKRIQIGVLTEPAPLLMVDGARDDRLDAEDLWRTIRDLPFAEQCRVVRRHLFHSENLFDLLLKKSRLEGRKSRQAGIKLAQLALISLERSSEVFGERIHDLRALAWAWLANAYRLALDFSAAVAAFERADREWATPRAKKDLAVSAHVCCLRGVLRMMRREYGDATRELDHSCSLFRQSGQDSGEALALTHRAMIHIYAGKLGRAVEDLREAADLIDEEKERELAFAIWGNLGNALALAGETRCAATALDRARCLSPHIDDPLGTPKLEWIAGLIAENHADLDSAKRRYQDARDGFSVTNERRYFALVTVDLMLVHSLNDDWETVGLLAAETLPILSSLTLHTETLATVNLLAQAIDAGSVSSRLLNDLQGALRQDPLVS